MGRKLKLKWELYWLERKFHAVEEQLIHLSMEHSPSNGHCCPSCASPEYRKLSDEQEQRANRINEILTEM